MTSIRAFCGMESIESCPLRHVISIFTLKLLLKLLVFVIRSEEMGISSML